MGPSVFCFWLVTTATATPAAQACNSGNPGVCCDDPVGICGSSSAHGWNGKKCKDAGRTPFRNACVTEDGNFSDADNCCYYAGSQGDYCALCSLDDPNVAPSMMYA